MFAHCLRAAFQKALVTFAFVLSACVTVTIDATRVVSDARQWTLKAQDSSEPKAAACHQAATAAAVAAANVRGTQLRGQAVPDELWGALKNADREMQSACSEIPK